MTFSVGYVTYFPEQKFFQRLALLQKIGIDVYVFDNSPECEETRIECSKLEKAHYITAGKNVGLGIALAVLCATAYSENKETLLFFDQDTGLTNDTLEYVKTFVEKQTNSNEYAAVVFEAKKIQKNDELKDVLLAISSGSLFFLGNLKKMNWHNESFYVDCVDYEFCLRARVNGLKVGVCGGTPGFDHESEQPDRFFYFLGRRLAFRRYPFWRIKDATTAYIRLVLYTLRNFDFEAFFVMIRSFGIFIVGQLLALAFAKK